MYFSPCRVHLIFLNVIILTNVTCVSVTLDAVLDWILDLLTTLIHNS
jgi:hypothetical protein